MEATDLRQMAAVQNGTAAQDKSQTRVDKIYKMFTPEERIREIKSDKITIEIGSGDEKRSVWIRPLTPRNFIEAFGLIREVLVPLMSLYAPNAESPSMGKLIEMLGERVDKVPDLLYFIIKRGNNDVTKDWVMDNLDMGLDLQLILPPFIVQNGLERILGGADAPEKAAPSGASTEKAASALLSTAESPA